MALVTNTRTDPLDGATLDEDWCHRPHPLRFDRALCGHREWQPPHFGDNVNGVCDGCGLRCCPDCEYENGRMRGC